MAAERNGMWLIGGFASVAAGALHGVAAGTHTEHTSLARLMVTLAAAQCVAGILVLVSERRSASVPLLAVNGIAVSAWAYTRIAGVPWIDGLTAAEPPQVADTVCAALGASAVLAVALGFARPYLPRFATIGGALALSGVAVAAMLDGVGHVHSHSAGAHAAAAHPHASGEHPGAAHAGGGHATQWPRPYDPAKPADLSGVAGVSSEQQHRAEALIRDTQARLPAFADVNTVGALGYRSIGDAATGYEHYVNVGYIRDGRFLDAAYPESLVYRADGAQRTLVSAMYIAGGKHIDDPELTGFGGPLMQWHVHANLCWRAGVGGPQVAGVLDAQGNCPPGSVNPGAGNPMVHVWIVAHECGPFAALEGHGAGQTAGDGRRADTCAHDHAAGHK